MQLLQTTAATSNDTDNEDDELSEKTAPDFTCSLTNHKYHLHTHAPAAHIIYHLGKDALKGDSATRKSLSDLAASHWNAIQLTKGVIAKTAPLKIRIPGGKMVQKL